MSADFTTAIQIIVEEMGAQKKALHLALNRKRRALESLSKADSDISAISGALAALEGTARRLGAAGSRQETGVQEPAPPPQPEPLRYITLGGEHIITDQPQNQAT